MPKPSRSTRPRQCGSSARRAAEAERVVTSILNATERSVATVCTGITTTLKQSAAELERSLTAASTGASGTIKQSAGEVERTLTAVSTGVSNVLKQNAGDVERTLLGASAEAARSFVGKADEISPRSASAPAR